MCQDKNEKQSLGLFWSRAAQYLYFLINFIILFVFLSIPILIAIIFMRAYQYQYFINYSKSSLINFNINNWSKLTAVWVTLKKGRLLVLIRWVYYTSSNLAKILISLPFNKAYVWSGAGDSGWLLHRELKLQSYLILPFLSGEMGCWIFC